MLKYIGDFEKLKEMGFIYREETKDDYEAYYIDIREGCCLTRVVIYPHSRKIYIVGGCYDILYDLIKEGLIKKVEE